MASTKCLVLDASTTLGNTQITVMAYNASRNYLYLENVGAVQIWINQSGGTAGVASLGSTLLVPSGSTGVSAIKWETTVPTNAITAIASAAGAALTAIQTVNP